MDKILAILIFATVFPLSATIYRLISGRTIVYQIVIFPLSMLGIGVSVMYASYVYSGMLSFIISTILAVILIIIGLILARRLAIRYINSQVKSMWTSDLSKQSGTEEFIDFFIELDSRTAKLKRKEEDTAKLRKDISSMTTEIEQKISGAVERFTQQGHVIHNILRANSSIIRLLKENAENAEDIAGSAKRSAVKIDVNNKNVQKSVLTLRSIISKIKFIDDLSFQTNILALNASIEAAKAGQNGKEFAVVASSIQKLSEKSKKSAAEIDKISQSGIQLSERTGRISAQIVPDIKTTAKQITKIAETTKKQHQEAEILSYTIAHLETEISHFTETTQDINRMIQELTDLVRSYETQGGLKTSFKDDNESEFYSDSDFEANSNLSNVAFSDDEFTDNEFTDDSTSPKNE